MTGAKGYRLTPRSGPTLRTDIVDVYVFRRRNTPAAGDADAIQFLQLLRSRPPLAGGWHPVMGHIEAGETACACAVRELREEINLAGSDPAFVGLWALEQTHPYFVAAIDCIVLSPRFAAEVDSSFTPTLNEEHDACRWVNASDVGASFAWPSQSSACAETLRDIAPLDAPSRALQRVAIE